MFAPSKTATPGPSALRSHASPKSEKHPTFSNPPVTLISRPTTYIEAWTLYNFEKHAIGCVQCRKPDDVYQKEEKLCDDGLELAISVVALPLALGEDDAIFERLPKKGGISGLR